LEEALNYPVRKVRAEGGKKKLRPTARDYTYAAVLNPCLQFPGLVSHNNFAGSLKYVFFNDISIIYELKRGNPKVHYIGVLDPEFYEADVEVIPITFPFPSAHIWWDNKKPDSLNITFDFKSARSFGVLASCNVSTSTGNGNWLVC